jgi:predicted nucleotidyltransferase component of viral defense system
MSEKKNIVASVKGRLLQIARTEGKNHQLLLLRYFQERFLYRLSLSRYDQHFCLKGAAFLYALEGERSRVTKDIDFLGMGIQSNQESLRRVIRNICDITYEEDGVVFDMESLSIEDIIKDGNYKGVRIGIIAHLERTKQRLQIDIGFGDEVVPAPVKMTYPVILDMEAPVLFAYSIESTIAEKFEAMIDLGEVNTRMKDFYDVYHLLENHDVDFEVLEQAIQQTIERRQTATPKDHSLFYPDFYLHEERNFRWKAWLRKAQLDTELEFSQVMGVIDARLKPIYLRLR